MFSGIVAATGRVEALVVSDAGARLAVRPPARFGRFRKGESISVSGACLTALSDSPVFRADLSPETLARTALAPWLLTTAAAFALATTGMLAARVAKLYELFYGRHRDSFYDMASREPTLGGFSSQIVPLIAGTGIALVLVAVARLARERNLEDVRENIVIRTGVFVALMVGSLLMTHFLNVSATGETGLAVFSLFAIAGATLYALTIAAKLCAQGAELVARDPAGLPAAKVVRS